MRPAKPKPQSTKLPNYDRNYKIPKNLPTHASEGRRTPKLVEPVQEETRGISTEVAEAVIERAQGKCEMCDRYPGTVPLQISHTIAKGMGGTHGEQSKFINSPENLRYLCEICHLKLFHGTRVVYNAGKENEISCETCWLFTVCHETAIERGILNE